MSPKEKATELLEKFGSNALDILQETLLVWEAKKLLYSQEMKAYKYSENKYESAKRGFEISERTLKYWNKVKLLI